MDIYTALYNEIERHVYEYEVDEFFVGYYGNFDRIAVRAVNEFSELEGPVCLTLVMHYMNKESYIDIIDLFTGAIYPDGLEKVPLKYAIVKGNQKMIDKVDYLIAYARDTTGNTGRLLEYARKREKRNKLKITLIEPKK